jgi:hypothetical protein
VPPPLLCAKEHLTQSLKPEVQPLGARGAPGVRISGCADIGLSLVRFGRFSRGGCILALGGRKSVREMLRQLPDPNGFLLPPGV